MKTYYIHYTGRSKKNVGLEIRGNDYFITHKLTLETLGRVKGEIGTERGLDNVAITFIIQLDS